MILFPRFVTLVASDAKSDLGFELLVPLVIVVGLLLVLTVAKLAAAAAAAAATVAGHARGRHYHDAAVRPLRVVVPLEEHVQVLCSRVYQSSQAISSKSQVVIISAKLFSISL